MIGAQRLQIAGRPREAVADRKVDRGVVARAADRERGRRTIGVPHGQPRETTRFGQWHDQRTLDLVARGLDNAAIARRMNLASKTVRNRVSALLAILDVPDRAGAISRARAAGLGVERPA